MDTTYDFIHVPKKEYFVSTDKDFEELLMKWYLKVLNGLDFSLTL